MEMEDQVIGKTFLLQITFLSKYLDGGFDRVSLNITAIASSQQRLLCARSGAERSKIVYLLTKLTSC